VLDVTPGDRGPVVLADPLARRPAARSATRTSRAPWSSTWSTSTAGGLCRPDAGGPTVTIAVSSRKTVSPTTSASASFRTALNIKIATTNE
jgi:hypothetical protein